MRFLENIQTQKELFEKYAARGCFIVYGYLRSKSSSVAKVGSPYYIGIATNALRPYAPHTRGGRSRSMHQVPVPSDRRLIRLFGSFATKEEACVREIQLIGRYGRKHLDDGGILLNRSLGGELGAYGAKRSSQAKRRLSAIRKDLNFPALAAEADVMGVEPEWFYSLTPNQKKGVRKRFRDGIRGEALLVLDADSCKAHGYSQRKINEANKYQIDAEAYSLMTPAERNAMKAWCARNPNKTGSDYVARAHPCEKYGLNEVEWKKLAQKQRNAIVERYRRGLRGSQLLEATETRVQQVGREVSIKAAERFGIELEVWMNFSTADKERIAARFRSGKRGQALYDGFNHGRPEA